jgi:hypothetical protein
LFEELLHREHERGLTQVRAAMPDDPTARSTILGQAEQLAKAGAALRPGLANLDPGLLGHTMLSFAEMLGRLAVSDPESFPRERLEQYTRAAIALLGGR